MPGSPTVTTTVPTAFVQRMLDGARRHLAPGEVAAIVRLAGIEPGLLEVAATRVTRAQFTRLYGDIAVAMGDEMLGLWSRPIRAGTLKYLGLSLLDAASLLVALYRFTRFWNLLLDDYRLELVRSEGLVFLKLLPRDGGVVASVFGHELMVKLTHGVLSWLAGRRLPVEAVGFAFDRPPAFIEYAAMFPEQVCFGEPATFICFAEPLLQKRFSRTKGELLRFVRKAPDDWLFVTLDETSLVQRVRDLVGARTDLDPSLEDVAASLALSTRSLSRKLADEGQNFRAIKDAARRDRAIERLVRSSTPIAQIAAEVGFDDLSAFHRAFRAWTGSTPKVYRRQQQLVKEE
jgi:AraC-like DNA-binding protein